MRRGRGPEAELNDRRFPYLLSFLFGIFGFIFGFALLAVWHTYGAGPVCFGALRWEHFNTGIVLLFLGGGIAAIPRRGVRPIGFFFIALGLGLIADDFMWHYAIQHDGFSYIAGCS